MTLQILSQDVTMFIMLLTESETELEANCIIKGEGNPDFSVIVLIKSKTTTLI